MNSICVGGREEGKSTLSLWLAYSTHKVVVVFDPRAMYDGVIVYDADSLEKELNSLTDFVRDNPRAPDTQPIVYRYDNTDVDFAFNEMATVLFPPQFTRGGFALVVDEAGELQGPNSINPALKRAVSQHPTKGELRDHIIQTSHRLSEFNGKVKTCLDHLYIFRTKNPRDLQALEDFTGEPEMVRIVQDLRKHHLIHYLFARQDDGVAQYEIWIQPGKWYTPINKQIYPSSRVESISDSELYQSPQKDFKYARTN